MPQWSSTELVSEIHNYTVTEEFPFSHYTFCKTSKLNYIAVHVVAPLTV